MLRLPPPPGRTSQAERRYLHRLLADTRAAVLRPLRDAAGLDLTTWDGVRHHHRPVLRELWAASREHWTRVMPPHETGATVPSASYALAAHTPALARLVAAPGASEADVLGVLDHALRWGAGAVDDLAALLERPGRPGPATAELLDRLSPSWLVIEAWLSRPFASWPSGVSPAWALRPLADVTYAWPVPAAVPQPPAGSGGGSPSDWFQAVSPSVLAVLLGDSGLAACRSENLAGLLGTVPARTWAALAPDLRRATVGPLLAASDRRVRCAALAVLGGGAVAA